MIGETNNHPEVRQVFAETAQKQGAPIWFADEEQELLEAKRTEEGCWTYNTRLSGSLQGTLTGECQPQNTNTILCALRRLLELGYNISDDHIRHGFANVCSLTGLMGRWQTVMQSPHVVCDIAHNPAGLKLIAQQLEKQSKKQEVHIVIGMVSDKDVSHSLAHLPRNAYYYFTQPA